MSLTRFGSIYFRQRYVLMICMFYSVTFRPDTFCLCTFFLRVADPEGPGVCALILTSFSFLLFLVTLPFSLCMCMKVSTTPSCYLFLSLHVHEGEYHHLMLPPSLSACAWRWVPPTTSCFLLLSLHVREGEFHPLMLPPSPSAWAWRWVPPPHATSFSLCMCMKVSTTPSCYLLLSLHVHEGEYHPFMLFPSLCACAWWCVAAPSCSSLLPLHVHEGKYRPPPPCSSFLSFLLCIKGRITLSLLFLINAFSLNSQFLGN